MLHLDSEESFSDDMVANSMGYYLQQWAQSDLWGYTGGGPEQVRVALAMVLLWNFSLNGAERVIVPEPGVGSFATAIAEACLSVIRLSTPVQRIVLENDSVKGVVTDAGETVDADAVICATTATTAMRIVPDLPAEIRSVLGNVRYSPFINVVIGLDHEVLPEGCYSAVFPRDAESILAAVSNVKAFAPKAMPEGKAMLHTLAM